MFPLNSNSRNNIDPAAVSYYTDQSILHNNRPFLNDVIISPNNPNPNPSSKQEENYSHSLSPFFHFPSPNFIHHDLELLEDPETLHHLLQHHHHHHYDDHLLHTQQQQQQQPPPQKLSTNMMVVDSAAKEKISTTIPLQKRSSKRDRHSKINTAKGLRDRRMRLSLEVAKEFFGLQDMLGFDKGSKTVEWLLTQAKPEIKALAKTKGIEIQSFSASGNGAKTNSSTSDCEVVSGVDETTTRESTSNNSKEKCTPSNKGKKIRKCREIAIRPHARDLREKARERARERTREKMWRQKMDGPKLRCIIDEAINNSSNNSNSNNNSNEINQLSSWSSFETTGEESGTQSMQLHDEHLGGNYNQEGEGFREDSNMIVGTWSSSSTVLNYLPNMIIPQEQQFPDFRFVGKL